MEYRQPEAMKNPLYNRVLFVLSLAGLLIAGYLWFLHATHGDVPCGGSAGCDKVAQSPYARFPARTGPFVAAYGTLGYIGLTLLSFLRTLGGGPARDRFLLRLIVLGAGIGTVFSLYLTYLELNVIHAICKWCVASQALIIGILIAGIAESLQPDFLKNTSPTTGEPLPE